MVLSWRDCQEELQAATCLYGMGYILEYCRVYELVACFTTLTELISEAKF